MSDQTPSYLLFLYLLTFLPSNLLIFYFCIFSFSYLLIFYPTTKSYV